MTLDAKSIHASCVAWRDRAVLIVGASGKGKSSLALQLMALGCALVADDKVMLREQGGKLMASPPDTLAGMIEARGIGILQADFRAAAEIVFVVDLDMPPAKRFPEPQTRRFQNLDFPVVSGGDGSHFPAAVLQLLKGGWARV